MLQDLLATLETADRDDELMAQMRRLDKKQLEYLLREYKRLKSANERLTSIVESVLRMNFRKR